MGFLQIRLFFDAPIHGLASMPAKPKVSRAPRPFAGGTTKTLICKNPMSTAAERMFERFEASYSKDLSPGAVLMA